MLVGVYCFLVFVALVFGVEAEFLGLAHLAGRGLVSVEIQNLIAGLLWTGS